MGVLTRSSGHARPSARHPIKISGIFVGHTCLESHLQTSPPTTKKPSKEFLAMIGGEKVIKGSSVIINIVTLNFLTCPQHLNHTVTTAKGCIQISQQKDIS